MCFVALRETSSKRIQHREANDAKKVLGYQDVTFLDLSDGYLDERVIDIVQPLEEVFKTYNPTTVYTCNSTDTNQDHQAVFKATMIVCRPHCTRVK